MLVASSLSCPGRDAQPYTMPCSSFGPCRATVEWWACGRQHGRSWLRSAAPFQDPSVEIRPTGRDLGGIAHPVQAVVGRCGQAVAHGTFQSRMLGKPLRRPGAHKRRKGRLRETVTATYKASAAPCFEILPFSTLGQSLAPTGATGAGAGQDRTTECLYGPKPRRSSGLFDPAPLRLTGRPVMRR